MVKKKPEITDYTMKKAYTIGFADTFAERHPDWEIHFIHKKDKWFLVSKNNQKMNKEMSASEIKNFINSKMNELDRHKMDYDVEVTIQDAAELWYYIFGEDGKREKAME